MLTVRNAFFLVLNTPARKVLAGFVLSRLFALWKYYPRVYMYDFLQKVVFICLWVSVCNWISCFYSLHSPCPPMFFHFVLLVTKRTSVSACTPVGRQLDGRQKVKHFQISHLLILLHFVQSQFTLQCKRDVDTITVIDQNVFSERKYIFPPSWQI